MITKGELDQLIQQYKDTPRKIEINNIKFGTFCVDVPDVASFLSQVRELFYEREYDFNSSNSSPVIIDLGANIGMSCLFFSSIFPQSKIYAFEADPHIFNYLHRNLNNNHVANVTLYNQAVWVEDTHLKFQSTGTDAGHINDKINHGELVKAVDISNFLDKFDEIELLKIDIEGAENQVFPHIASHLSKVKQIVVEYHSSMTEQQTLSNIISLLEKHQFRYHIHHINRRLSPLINRTPKGFFDCQLNIFAIKYE